MKATFFVLGMCAKNYPAIVAEVAARGHELASHGTAHARVHTQTPDEFRADLEASIALIGELGGRRPVGYRAPAFSINRDTPWAYEILAELGFRYDSSQYDSPRIPRRIEGIPHDAYRLRLGSGLELGSSRSRSGGRAGACSRSGRRLLARLPDPAPPARAARRRTVRRVSSLYFHPYEFDPAPLRAELPRPSTAKQRLKAAQRSLYRNPGRRRTPGQLARVAQEFPLVTYESALGNDALGRGSEKTLSRGGAVL